ncbi:hypothetical protein EUX98_g8991 [Antrodiella citrinella]|uniref:Uncharacterized protein n=1 Tax=Antrodiella citrinella TaxID=2447956 RepID=A0A4S4M1F1_9APHY|nr:hypothetical protein EUX98_g8991 [Antrodiella citrinella]
MQVARELFPEVTEVSNDDRMDMHSDDDNGVHDAKGKGKTVDKGDIESGDEDKNKDEDQDEGEDEEAEIQPDIMTESRPKNARPRAPTVTSPRAGEKKKRARQTTPVKQLVIPAAVAKEVPQDKEMEDGEIPPSPVTSYVRPHTPIPLKEWDNSLTQMLMSQKITARDSRATQDKPHNKIFSAAIENSDITHKGTPTAIPLHGSHCLIIAGIYTAGIYTAARHTVILAPVAVAVTVAVTIACLCTARTKRAA